MTDDTTSDEPTVETQTAADAAGGDTVRFVETVVTADAHPVGDRMLESGQPNDDYGFVWEMTMIRPGVSRNRTRYRNEVLAEARGRYEGARAFDGHRNDQQRNQSAIGTTAGYWKNIRQESDGRLVGQLHILKSARSIRDTLVAAWEAGRADLIGVSHDVYAAKVTTVNEGGGTIRDVGHIVEVSSVDLVAEPSAGGGMERLVASTQPATEERVKPMDRDELLEALNNDDELAAAAREALGVQTDDDKTTEPVAETVAADDVLQPGTLMHRIAIREALADSALPEQGRSRLRETLTNWTGTIDQLIQRVAEFDDMWSDLVAATPAPLPGQQTRVTEDEADKHQAALDGMLFGRAMPVGEAGDKVPPFRSIKQAYHAFTGRTEWDAEGDFGSEMLAASSGGVPHGSRRLQESIVSSTWAQALGDSITRRAIAEYQLPQRQSWRRVVSEFSSPTDFRTQRPFRVGGYDVLPTVAEGAAYTSLTSPTDEEAPYAVGKKGGTEDLTWETMKNDDVGALRSIPINLGRAAALSIYRDVWDIFPTNAAIYDAVALFAAGHNNDQAIALGNAGLTAARTAMRRQQRAGETSGDLNFVPRILVVPPELEETAFQLVTSAVAVSGTQDATVPNLHQGYEAIVVPELADANDWFAVADPQMCPTIEVGFLDGRDEPEILIQDQPTVGTVFTNDVFTYKVRFVYGVVVLDYRGFFRGTQV